MEVLLRALSKPWTLEKWPAVGVQVLLVVLALSHLGIAPLSGEKTPSGT